MSTQDVCGADVQALYLHDPGNKKEPAGYVLCSELGNTCMKNGCSCRSSNSATINGTTKYFGVCVVLKKGADCVTSGDDYITCDTGSGTAQLTTSSTTESQNEPGGTSMTPTPNTMATKESNSVQSTATKGTASSPSASSSGNVVKAASAAAASKSMSTTEMVIIIIIAVIFVAFVSSVVRKYCMRRLTTQKKLEGRRNRSANDTRFDATSPTNISSRSSPAPSFPAFDRRARAGQSPTAGQRARDEARSGRGNPNTPRAANREPAPERAPEIDFGPREPKSGRGLKANDLQIAINMKREPKSGRGLKPQDLMASMPAPGMQRPEPVSGRGRRSPDQPREPKSGRGRRDPDAYGPEPVMQREPSSAHGRRNHQAEPPMRTPPREQAPKPAKPTRPNAPEPPGGTVYGRDTYDRVAQFAHLAAFEAPPPPPPRPQKPIKPVPVADPLPKYARAPPPNPNAARPAPKQHSGFTIDETPEPMDYDILSPKTARSLAPSVASSVTTVAAPGRNRPTPLQQNRRPPPPSYYQSDFDESRFDESKFDESKFSESKFDESRYDKSRYDETRYKGRKNFNATNSFDESFVSEVSSMAWSGVSDDSYYHAAASNTARIPVIEAPHDDDDRSEDGYSDWGHSTQQSDAFCSTAASNASIFSVNSDFKESEF